MAFRVAPAVATITGGIAAGIRARPKMLGAVALAVFVLSLVLPVIVLSVARKPVDYFTFNPWLSRLPEYLASGHEPLRRKVAFLSQMAILWFSADNPVEGVEWGFILDVPSLGRLIFTSLLFGVYFALWFHRRDQARHCGWGARAGRHGGVAGTLTSVLGVSTTPCSVMGCGVPVLPVVGMAVTGVSSGTLQFFASFSRVAIAVVLVGTTAGVVWLGWLVGNGQTMDRAEPVSGPARPSAGSSELTGDTPRDIR